MTRLAWLLITLVLPVANAKAADISTMFWTDAGSVYRANIDGTGKTKIYDVSQGQVNWFDVDVTTQKLYLRGGVTPQGGDGGLIRRMNYDGTGLSDVLTGLNYSGFGFGLDGTNRTMYFGDFGLGMFSANMDDGSNKQPLPGTNLLRHTHDMQVSGGKLYYINGEFAGLPGYSGIRRADLDGSNITDIISGANGTIGFACIAIDEVHGKLYWSQDYTDSILRSDLNGSNRETFLSGISAYDLEIDAAASQLFFTTSWSSSYLYRVNLDGTGLTPLVQLSGEDGAKGLALAPAAVPEPSSIVIMGELFAALGVAVWWRRRKPA